MIQLVVLSCVLAAASASGLLGVAPYATGVLGVSPFAPLGVAPLAYSGVWNNNYRGPLSLAPGQPANILAADGRPLDTLDVNLDRSAHLIAKGLTGVHLLKKRSVGIAPLITPVASRIALAPSPLITPLGYGAHIAPYGLSPYSSIAPISPYARIASPLITQW